VNARVTRGLRLPSVEELARTQSVNRAPSLGDDQVVFVHDHELAGGGAEAELELGALFASGACDVCGPKPREATCDFDPVEAD